MLHGSLFSGIGGFDRGFDEAGFETAWLVENDKHCQSVLDRHWSSVPLFGDIAIVDSAELAAVDVITFGSPCQDMSVAGKRAGIGGEKSRLYFEAIRIIRDIQPEFAVWENVPGALSSNSGRDFGAALDALAEAGALDIAWRVLDAQWFGLAQRRKRVFVIADFRGYRAAQILSVPEGGKRDLAPSREAEQRVAGTVAASTHPSGFNGQGAYADHLVASTLRSRQHADGVNPPGRGGEDDQYLVVAQSLNTAFHRDATVDTFIVTGTLGTTDLTGNGAEESFLVAHTLRPEGCDASEDGTGRGVPLVCDTTQMTSDANYSNPRPGDDRHPLASGAHPPLMVQPMVRRLTPVECERLQGFPDGWTDGVSDSQRYKMLGNAVAVPCAAWIAKRIVAALT
jgi:DNA (cytosine-5)-methyltransferase 1